MTEEQVAETNGLTQILIVEDSAVQAAALRRILADAGYAVAVAKDGTSGLATVKRAKPALIISDILMPQMDGFELCRALKSDEAMKDIPVILLTSLTDPSDVIHGLECGADNFVTKPYEPKYLLSRVQYMLAGRSVASSERTQLGVEIYFAGRKYMINSERKQILDLLIATYESAVTKNVELIRVQHEMKILNEKLERMVEERTAALTEEINERKRAEVFARSVLENINVGLVTMDREGRILTTNRAYAEQIGLLQEDIVGRHCYEIEHHMPKPCYEYGEDCPMKNVLDTDVAYETMHKHFFAQGVVHYINDKAFPLYRNGKGEVATVLKVTADITDKIKMEEQFRQAQKMEAVGRLSAGIAHDFNNILSAIIGFGHVALHGMKSDDPQRLNIEQILEAANRATHLTQSLLSFSRKQAMDVKPIDINVLVSDMQNLLSRILGETINYKTAFNTHLSPAEQENSSGIWISGDKNQLEQILLNMAMNARDAMPVSGTFTVSTSRLEMGEGTGEAYGYLKKGEYACISLEDTGTGMSEEVKRKIFEPFFTTKEIGKGSGLGLAMAYGAVKQHGGFIHVYSERGEGTVFRIYLPLSDAKKTEIDRKEPSIDEKNDTPGGSETILLAEDDRALRTLDKTILEQFGYHVIMAVDGKDAVEKFIENEEKIDLLLFDIIMPVMRGQEAFMEIHKINSQMPVIFMTGYSPGAIEQTLPAVDREMVIQKPVSPKELLMKIRAALDKKVSG